jgi:hypothetical protein
MFANFAPQARGNTVVNPSCVRKSIKFAAATDRWELGAGGLDCAFVDSTAVKATSGTELTNYQNYNRCSIKLYIISTERSA